MVDGNVDQCAVVDCPFEVFSGKKCASYKRGREVTATVDCSGDQSAAVASGFTVPWGIAGCWLPISV